MKKEIVIVGGGIAGIQAAFAAREVNKNMGITIVSEEPYQFYRRPSIPLLIYGRIKPSDIKIYPMDYFKKKKIKVLKNEKALKINIDKNFLKTDKRKLKFNKLILATGGRPFKPNIPGINKKGVFQIRKIDNALAIKKFLKPGKKAIVIGAGFIGLMMSEALFKQGMKVTIVEKASQVLPALFEPELSKVIQNNLEIKGIEIILNATVDEIYGEKKVSKVKVLEKKFEASLVVCATGVIPNIDLAEQIGLRIGEKAILTDSYFCTSNPDIYAAGDCIEVLELVSKKIRYIPIGSIAAIEGKIAGTNAAGKLIKHEGFIRSQNEKIFNLELVSMGLTFNEAKLYGITPLKRDITDRIFEFGRKEFEKAVCTLNSKNSIIGLQIITQSYAHRYSMDLLKAIESKTNIEKFLSEKHSFKTLFEIKHRT
ncbi:MAG: FAD/NAD(P)-binding oxidoreductase [Candidatus Bathyarchaeia archaeon]